MNPVPLSPSLPSSLRRALLGLGVLSCVPACAPPVTPLRVGSIVFSGYEPLFLARALGLLPEKKVKLVELMSNTDTLRALATQQLEAAALTMDEFLTGRANGLDVKVVAVLDLSRGADGVIARSGLVDPLKTQGRRVAVEEGAVGAVVLAAFLRARGLQPQDVKLVPYTMDKSLSYFENGRADFFVTAAPWLMRLESAGGTRVFDSTAIPERIVDVLVVRSAVLDTHAEAIHTLVQGHFQALARFKAEPQQMAPLMAPRMGIPATEVPAAFEGLLLPDAPTSRQLLSPDGDLLRQVKTLMDTMVQDGLLRNALPATDLFEPRFHPPSTAL